MKKNNKRTYAEEARRIIARYRKRLGDNLERSDKLSEESLQRELDALAERQEMAKQAEAENQYREMCKGGKLPKMEWGSYLPGGNMWDTITNPQPRTVLKPGTILKPGTTVTPMGVATVANSGSKNEPNSPSWWSQIPTESKIGMGAQLAGVLGQGIISATAGKPKDLKYQDISIPEPELIRNDEQIAAATRAYRGAQNNLRYLSPSQYMAGMSDLATREAAAKAGIIEGTANQNAEILNRSRWQQYAAQRDNAANRLSVDQYNEAMRQNYIGNIGQMVGNIAGVAAGTMKDESARKMQNSMMGFMNQANYGSVVGKNGYPIATKRVGNTETWEDIDGPHYRVNGQEVGLNEFIAAFEKHQKSLQTNTEKK